MKETVLTATLCLTLILQVNGQFSNHKNISLENSYSEISPLGRYLYDSILYESARAQTEYEYITMTFPNDGYDVEAYLCRPKKIAESQKLPVIIYNRGGTGNYGKLTNEIFPYFYELAREGYVVLGTNYRFVGEFGKYDQAGGEEINDVIELVRLAKELPYVDSENVFMLGISRGGLMTYKTIAEIEINAAAVIGGVADNFAGLEDRPIFIEGWDDLSEEENYLGLKNILPDFEENKEKYLTERSPVLWADKIKSPVLIMHSRQDGLVKVTQALDMAMALQKEGKSYQLKVYNDKSHSLPSQYFDSAVEVLKWFKKHEAK